MKKNFESRRLNRQSANRNRQYRADYREYVDSVLFEHEVNDVIDEQTDWSRWYNWQEKFEWNQHRYGYERSAPDFSDNFIAAVKEKVISAYKEGSSKRYCINLLESLIQDEGMKQYVNPSELSPAPSEIVISKDRVICR